MASVKNTPVFHEHPGIEPSPQLELFDVSQYQLHYVTKRPPYRKRMRRDARQLLIEGVFDQTGTR